MELGLFLVIKRALGGRGDGLTANRADREKSW